MGSRVIIILSGLLLTGQLSFANLSKEPAEEVSLLAKGKRLLREGDWYRASKVFEELAGRFSKSDNLDQFVFYRAKAKYYSGELNEAVAGFAYFLNHFSDSRERAYAHFFLGNAQYRMGNVDQAVKSYLESYRLAEDQQLNDLSAASLVAAFKNASSINLGTADFAVLPENRRCALIKLLANVLVDRGDTGRAEELLASCNKRSDRSSRQRDLMEVALVLPFSGELRSFGEDIYNGAVVAAEICRSETAVNLKLVPYDTKGDPVNAARVVGKLLESQAEAAIGPLTSEEASVASARLSCGSFPLLIPAATQAGLTQLSETSFQLSPNIELQGVRLAEYAISSLRADSAVILTSISAEHLQMAKAFLRRFQQLGGTVVATEYYRPRDKDFGPYIRDVKAVLLGKHPDSAFFINEEGDTLDIDGIPAQVDCLFLPGSTDQIRLLLPQITFYNLNGSYLGSDGWGYQAVLKLGDDITKGAVFPSPYLTVDNSEEYVRMAAAYDARFGHRPNRLATLGYDAIRLVTRAIQTGDGSKQNVVEELKKVRNYYGASGKFTFGKNRENVEMPLFRILSEQAVPLSLSEDSLTN